MTRSDVFLGAVLARVVPVRTWRDGIRAFGTHGITAAVACISTVVAIQFGPTLATLRGETRPVPITSFAVWHGMMEQVTYKGF